MSKIWDKITEGQKEAITELIAELELDDAENSIRNASRCLNEQGYLELQNMVADYYYRSGINHIKNEIREILGLPRLETELEKKHREAMLKYPMGSLVDWDCPPLEAHEYEITEGSAKLLPLGEDATSMVVIGTKDRAKALRMMRRYERDWLDDDLLAQDRDIVQTKLVWRKADQEYDGEHTHMFSWSAKDTKRNPQAVDAVVFEG